MKKILMIKKIKLFLLLTILVGCEQNRNIKIYLQSDDKDSLIQGIYMIRASDTEYIKSIFMNPYDFRITHQRKYYGQSVYQAKMIMFQKLSNIKAPNKITEVPDTIVIDFYRNWAEDAGYLR